MSANEEMGNILHLAQNMDEEPTDSNLPTPYGWPLQSLLLSLLVEDCPTSAVHVAV
jgi:hypothetical protein